MTAPEQYEWQPDFIAGDAQRRSCYLRGPEVGNVTYSLMQTGDPRYAAEGDGRYASDIDSGHFVVANYYRITLFSDQEGKVRDLLNAANANVNCFVRCQTKIGARPADSEWLDSCSVISQGTCLTSYLAAEVAAF